MKATKWNTDLLKKDPNSVVKYQEALRNKYIEATQNRPNQSIDDIDVKWDETKKLILEVAKENIGEKKWKRNEEWFDDECRKMIEKKNNARRKMMNVNTRNNAETYRDLRREAKKILKAKKRNALKQKIKEIDELSKENEQRKFYAAINRMKKGFQPRINTCKDVNGEIITDNENILKRWTQHFKDLLNEEETEPTSISNDHRLEDEEVN
ncbi:hypothetical protein M8J77_020880 [Diaphorina citri]|nr:hypothetical protein M8J77_020880 [Diaphorina citri]